MCSFRGPESCRISASSAGKAPTLICVTGSLGEAQGQEKSGGWRNQVDELGAVERWEAVAEEAWMDWDELGTVEMWEAVAEEGKELLTKGSTKQWFCFSYPFSSILSTCSFHWSPALLCNVRA